MDEMICDRCKIGTENYFYWLGKEKQQTILCDECCKNFLLKCVVNGEVSIYKVEDFAHEPA